jgi:hypothetical protein
MTEFKEDDHVNYVHVDEDSGRFENINQIIRYVEGIRRRVSAGEFKDEQYRGNFTIFHIQTLDEEFQDLIKTLENTNNLYRLEEIQREGNITE